MQIFVRVKDSEELEKITLSRILYPEERKTDFLWESSGDYYLEAFQCGTKPSVCSIEKDPRILSSKEEIALMIMDKLNMMLKASVI
jgi:hypothetical protein